MGRPERLTSNQMVSQKIKKALPGDTSSPSISLGPKGRGPYSQRTTLIGHVMTRLCSVLNKKVQVGKDQEKAQSEKDFHYKNRGGKNQTNNQVLIP